MALQYLTVTQFGGLNKTGQLFVPINSAGNWLSRCDNYRGMADPITFDLDTPIVGMLTKSPEITNWKAVTPAAGRCRGIFQFYPDSTATNSWLMCCLCTTSYTTWTMYALDILNNTWKTLATGAGIVSYHFDFAQYGDKVYMTDGGELGCKKWWHGGTQWETVLPAMKDKGGTATAIAGATLTWNLTTTVTSDIDVSATISEGDWIRKSSASTYWDEVKTIDGAGTTITLMEASSENGASAAGGAEKAGLITNVNPRFILSWKNKLWLANNRSHSFFNSRLYWSVTGDPEDWSGTGSGYLDIPNTEGDGQQITGLGALDELLFVFKDSNYYVYRWTGDLTTPIELVKTFNYGCVSERTIQQALNGLIYLSRGDLRITNGSEDISLSDSAMKDYFSLSVGSNRMEAFWSGTATDNGYYWGLNDTVRGFYTLGLPGSTGKLFHYDYKNNRWAGYDNIYDAGQAIQVYADTAIPDMVYATSASTNQLKYLPNNGLVDHANSGILESCTYYSGYPEKKLKIHWVGFGIHPIASDAGGTPVIDTTLTFKYRKDLGALSTGISKNIDYTNAQLVANDNIVDQIRFPVEEVCNYFSWYLSEANSGSTTSTIGITSWTICYEIMDSV